MYVIALYTGYIMAVVLTYLVQQQEVQLACKTAAPAISTSFSLFQGNGQITARQKLQHTLRNNCT